MKQVLQSYRDGELWLADVPAPALRGKGVVVQTAASVVSSGTERMLLELARKSLVGKARARPDLVRKVLAKIRIEGWSSALRKTLARLDTPIPLGYSCSGTVVETAGAAGGLHPGDRVACGGAGYATHAEYNYVPCNLCARVPGNVSMEDAAFATIGAIAVQGVRQADARLGERVAVIGLGLIGLLTVQILKAAGCRVLGVDPQAQRCAKALELGADAAVDGRPEEAADDFSQGRGVDAVILTAATPSDEPLRQAGACARLKGRIVVVGLVGMHVPRDLFYHKELDLRMSMSYGPGRYDPGYEERGRDYPFAYVRWTEQRNMQTFLELVSAGSVAPGKLAERRFPIDRALDAYGLLRGEGQDPAGGVLGLVLLYPAREETRPPVRSLERSSAPAGRIGIGAIGAGAFGKGVLLPILARRNDVCRVALCAATGMSASESSRRFGFATAATDPTAVFEDSRVHAVFIATRHDSHAGLVCAALAAGKHVFVEKPLAVTPAQLEDIESAWRARDAGRGPVLLVGYNRRFSRHAAALRKVFADRRSPLLIQYRVNAGTVDPDAWLQSPEEGGGRLVGEACHFVDFCSFVAGSPPVRVHAESISAAHARIVDQDSVLLSIKYADGSLAGIVYAALGSGALPKERIELHADGKSAVLDDFRRTEVFGASQPPIRGRQDKGFEAEIEAFLCAVQGGLPGPVPFAELARTSRVTFAVLESLRKGIPVSL